MTSQLHKRLERLEALLEARVSAPIWRFVHDPYADTAAELERMVADGEIAEKNKGRVQIWRWLTREEALARGIEEPQPLPKPQPQLPAPPERKLLPPPAQLEPQQPQASPPVEAKRELTEEQSRRLLEDRERPFGRPIRYPKGMATP